ncbi:MAG: type 1 glutamine amidotransferase domain-containing protein, partial [Gammaproteobacteria bacterium]|nr:type 1 glutamine amidotransferase domain-containing protein [Gammaproteobacteria bacterium]
DFTSFAIQDGLIITGQNPMSSEGVAELLIDSLKK